MRSLRSPRLRRLFFLACGAVAIHTTVQPALADLRITQVQEGLGAAEAGLRQGDILTHWKQGTDGGSLDQPLDLMRLQWIRIPSDSIELHYRRNDQAGSVLIQLEHSGIRIAPVDTEASESAHADWKLAAADSAEQSGDQLQARKLRDQAQSGAQALPPNDAAMVLLTLRESALRNSEYSRASGLSASSLSLLEHDELASDVLLARTLLAMAQDADLRGDSKMALQHSNRALTLAEGSASESVLLASILVFRASQVASDRDVEGNQLKVDRASGILSGRLVPVSLNVSQHIAQSRVFQVGGDSSAALLEAERAVVLARSISDQPQALISALRQRAGLLVAQGEYKRLDADINVALLLATGANPGPAMLAWLHQLRAIVLNERMQAAEAEHELSIAIQLLRTLDGRSNALASALHNGGVIAESHGRVLQSSGRTDASVRAFTRAVDLYAQSISIKRESSPDSVPLSTSLIGLGMNLLELGRVDEATAPIEEGMAIVRKLAPDSLRAATSYDVQARLLREKGNLDASLDASTKSLAVRRKHSEGTHQIAVTEHDLGMLLHQLGNPTSALEHLRNAVDSLNAQLQKLGGTESTKASSREARAEIYRDYIDLLLESGDMEAAFKAESGYRLDASRALLGDTLSETSDSRTTVLPQSVGPATARISFLVGTRRSWLLLSYANGRDSTPERRTFEISAGRVELAQRIQALRTLTRHPHAPEDVIEAMDNHLHWLSERLIGPALPYLGNVKSLQLAVDGPLHGLPFAMLRLPPGQCGDQPDCYLIERFTLQLDDAIPPSSPDHALDTRQPLIAFGDSITSKSSTSGFRANNGSDLSALPHSRAEVEQIVALFQPDAEAWLGDLASERQSRERAGAAAYLHFATHAIVDELLPLESYLVLSSTGSGEHEDGLLHAREVQSEMQLKALLVTLSACETANGRNFDGSGVSSLAIAFRSAGAQAVIASQWRVDDEATAELMQILYADLHTGATPAAALRRAQIALLRGINQRPWWAFWLPTRDTRHPYYWSAFQLFGD